MGHSSSHLSYIACHVYSRDVQLYSVSENFLNKDQKLQTCAFLPVLAAEMRYSAARIDNGSNGVPWRFTQIGYHICMGKQVHCWGRDGDFKNLWKVSRILETRSSPPIKIIQHAANHATATSFVFCTRRWY